jgi:hypothetical protein
VAIHGRSRQEDPPSPPPDAETVDQQNMVRFLRSVQEFVDKNFEDVGAKLAEESLKIHYGVANPRNIRGVATTDEERLLQDEGIELLKIPWLKKPTDPKLN